jgi:hypothetical protein
MAKFKLGDYVVIKYNIVNNLYTRDANPNRAAIDIKGEYAFDSRILIEYNFSEKEYACVVPDFYNDYKWFLSRDNLILPKGQYKVFDKIDPYVENCHVTWVLSSKIFKKLNT